MAQVDYVTGVVIGMGMICCMFATIGFNIPQTHKYLRWFFFGTSAFFIQFVPNYIHRVAVEDVAPASIVNILETFVVATTTLSWAFLGIGIIYILLDLVNMYKEKMRIRDEEY